MTLFWGKNCRKVVLSVFCKFSTVFLPKNGVKCYSIYILRPDLGSSHDFYIIVPQNIYNFHIFIFNRYWHFWNFQIARAVIFLVNRYFWGQILNQHPKTHDNGWWGDRFAEKKMVITTWPNDLLEVFWGRGHDTPSPTANVLAGSLY